MARAEQMPQDSINSPSELPIMLSVNGVETRIEVAPGPASSTHYAIIST